MQVLNSTHLHVRFDGHSDDIDLATLGLRPDARDAEIRSALARHYDCSAAQLNDYVIQREPQAIIVRPMAIYG